MSSPKENRVTLLTMLLQSNYGMRDTIRAQQQGELTQIQE